MGAGEGQRYAPPTSSGQVEGQPATHDRNAVLLWGSRVDSDILNQDDGWVSGLHPERGTWDSIAVPGRDRRPGGGMDARVVRQSVGPSRSRWIIYLAPAFALPRFLGFRGGATTPAVFSSQRVGSGVVVVGGADEEGGG